MSEMLRVSPLHDSLAALNPRWGRYAGMLVPAALTDPAAEQSCLQSVALTDLSCLPRSGLKGPAAESWLLQQGLPVPAGINQWLPIGQCSLIARLATTEFFIEDGPGPDDFACDIRQKLDRGLAGVTPVLRQDAQIALAGPAAREVCAQTCSLNFAALNLDARPLVMTSMIGVSVLVIPRLWSGKPLFQIWCDPTFSAYLWKHLLEIAQELGGGAVGIAALFPNFFQKG